MRGWVVWLLGISAVAGCGGAPSAPQNTVPGGGGNGGGAASVALACSGTYRTTDPNVAAQTFTFSTAGQCGFSNAGLPNVIYSCSYSVVDALNAKVTFSVPNTTQGWIVGAKFAADCTSAAIDGFGVGFSRQ